MFGIDLYNRKKDPLFILLILSVFISQAIMIFSPISPLRTFFVTIVLIWCSIIYVVTRFDNVLLNYITNIIAILLLLSVVPRYGSLVKFFKENYQVNKINEQIIKSGQQNNITEKLILFKLPNIEYVFDMPYTQEGESKYCELNFLNNYYHIDLSTPIDWQPNSEIEGYNKQ